MMLCVCLMPAPVLSALSYVVCLFDASLTAMHDVVCLFDASPCTEGSV